MFRKNQFIVLALIIFSILLFNSVAYATLRVEPSRYIFYLEEGERATDVIKVTNNTNRPLNLSANYYDWELDEKYELVILESGSIKETLQGLIRFNPRDFTLNPGEEQIIRFTIDPFDGTDDLFERRGIIFFEHVDEFDGSEEGVGASVVSMIGTTVYVVPENQGFTFNLLDSLILKMNNDEYIGAVLTHNDSQRHVRFNIDYKIIDEDNELIKEGKTEERVVLPGEERSLMFPLEHDFNSGNYEIILDFIFSDTREKLTDIIEFQIE